MEHRQCVQCNKEIVSKGTKPKLYCSDACRMKYKLTWQTNKRTQPEKVHDFGEEIDFDKTRFKTTLQDGPGSLKSDKVIPEQPVSLKDLTARQLYQKINHYPHDTWKHSPEFKELQRRLETKTLEQLQAEGYWIPSRIRLMKGAA